jgi:2,3-bisphosphoglycerate-independent phosphoglycerate mutase
MRKVILVIRDGWGHRDAHNDNAIFEAHPKNTERLLKEYPHVLIDACGKAVGCPQAIRAIQKGPYDYWLSRIIFQSLERVNHSIADGSFYNIIEFNDA